MKTTARLRGDVDTVAKDLADMWDNSCECSAKNFNRQAWIKQVILHARALKALLTEERDAIRKRKEEQERFDNRERCRDCGHTAHWPLRCGCLDGAGDTCDC